MNQNCPSHQRLIGYMFFCIISISLLLSCFLAADADHPESMPISDSDSSDFISESEKDKLAEHQERHTYVAEMDRLMDLITNHLYRSPEVFLRELISNASDALEKTRFMGLSKEATTNRLEIRIEFDKDKKTISITDSGVGMTKDDLINNLGTVAKSGSTNFMEALGQSGGDVSLIGRFGVGFYAAFLVADRVTVTTKNDDSDQYIWESTADGSYTVAADPRGSTLVRGTRVTLHVKEDATDYLDESKLFNLASNFGKFIAFPIYVKIEKTETKEVEDEDADETKQDETEEDETKPEESNAEEKTKTNEKKFKKVEVKSFEWSLVNPDKAIWLRPNEEVSESEYFDFYKTIAKMTSDPISYVHFVAEGDIEFRSILYIPNKAPKDMFENYFSAGSNVKLYVRRSLVGENFEGLLPKYLQFIHGVISSDDIPLNVSREQLQQHKLIKIISKKLVKKTLELIRTMATESDEKKVKILKDIEEETDEDKKKILVKTSSEHTKFDNFWMHFSRSMKLGCYEDEANRSKVAKVLRFYTSQSDNELITLDQYLEKRKSSQKVIYYISGDSIDIMKSSPHMQVFFSKGLEVLYLLESMDEPCIQRLVDYEGNKFISVAKGDAEIEETEEEKTRFKKLTKMYRPLTKWFKDILADKVQKAIVSRRLVNDPCTIVASQHGHSASMEKLLKSQTFSDTKQLKSMNNQKIFEINANHPVIIDLLTKVNANAEDSAAKEIGLNLFHISMFASGFEVEDPSKIANMLYANLSKDLGVNVSDQLSDVDVSEVEIDNVKEKESDPDEIDMDEKEAGSDDLEISINGDEPDNNETENNENDESENNEENETENNIKDEL